jgi:hypothetical protein
MADLQISANQERLSRESTRKTRITKDPETSKNRFVFICGIRGQVLKFHA